MSTYCTEFWYGLVNYQNNKTESRVEFSPLTLHLQAMKMHYTPITFNHNTGMESRRRDKKILLLRTNLCADAVGKFDP